MDLRPYLALLAEKETEQKTELMRVQLHEYIEFIRSFADQANIMSKSFMSSCRTPLTSLLQKQ